jgi:hypothetical protein
MKKEIEIAVPPEYINDKEFLYNLAAQKLKLNPAEISAVIPLRRSIDARSSNPVFRILSIVYINEILLRRKNNQLHKRKETKRF